MKHITSFQFPCGHGGEYEGRMMLYNPVKKRRFEETCYIHYHGTH
jgi:hypothetical protein